MKIRTQSLKFHSQPRWKDHVFYSYCFVLTDCGSAELLILLRICMFFGVCKLKMLLNKLDQTRAKEHTPEKNNEHN